MESFKEFTEINIKRGSLLSTGERLSKNLPDVTRKPPQDKYFFDHILQFFYGLTGLMCFTFYLTANDFWMYKFRDVSQPKYDASNRTDLQAYFASATQISQSLPSVITYILVALYGHKIHIETRTLANVTIFFLMFLLTTILAEVNTDSWQTAFFVLILVIYLFINVAAIYFQFCSMTFIAKLPPQYTKSQLYGSGTSGILSAILQIIALALAKGSSVTGGLIYFSSGTTILFITLTLSYLSKYSAHHRFYMENDEIDSTKQSFNKKEIIVTLSKIWSCVYIFSIVLALIILYSINTLVVSEYYNTGTEWNKIYFVPIMTFLCPAIVGQLARYIARPIITKNNQWLIATIFTIKALIFGPSFMFCNTSPKVHTPLWFPHDWQYFLIMVISTFSDIYFMTVALLSVPKLAGEKTELAYIVMQTVSGIICCATSVFGPLFVKLL